MLRQGVAVGRQGRAVQVESMKLMLKAPGTPCLNLKYDKLLSNVAVNFNLHRYSKGLVAAYAPVVVALCGHPAVAAGHPLVRGAALAALSRLMAIDAAFCEVGPAGICRHYFWHNRQIDNARHMPAILRIFEAISRA